MWTYRCTAGRVIDGDTVELLIDLGFHVTIRHRIRLLGVDTPELNARSEDERITARQARDMVQQWLADRADQQLFVTTAKADGFGRYLGVVHTADDDLTEYLRAAGYPDYER